MARVVVVDDDRDLTDVVADILAEDAHQVIACNTAEDAIGCIFAARPDVVLLDIRLDSQPEAGWAILDQLRGNALTASTPVIVTSAAVDALHAREKWLRERGIPVLPKPFDIDDLLGLVQDVTGGEDSGARRQNA